MQEYKLGKVGVDDPVRYYGPLYRRNDNPVVIQYDGESHFDPVFFVSAIISENCRCK
jgi:hypothetical protein